MPYQNIACILEVRLKWSAHLLSTKNETRFSKEVSSHREVDYASYPEVAYLGHGYLNIMWLVSLELDAF